MEEYRERAEAGYSHGTLRCGPLHHISMVGQVSEESGGYFPEFLGETFINTLTTILHKLKRNLQLAYMRLRTSLLENGSVELARECPLF